MAVGFGAYVEMPLLGWCSQNGVPYIIHEQNSVPGLANRTCARDAAVVAVALPSARRTLLPKARPLSSLTEWKRSILMTIASMRHWG